MCFVLAADRVFTILESKSTVEPNEGDAPAAPFVSRAEQSRCGDPRRLLMLLALVTAALTTPAPSATRRD